MENNFTFIKWFYKILENPKIFDLSTKVFSFNNKRIEKYLPELIKVKPDDLILDVGCGTGRYAVFPCKYFGVDPSDDYINYAKENHRGIFLKMDGTDLKFPDNMFDFVINVSVLHHVSDGLVQKMITEMKRVCKKDGQIFTIEAVYGNKINFLWYLAFKLDRGKNQRTFGQLENLLSKHNFKVITDNLGKTFISRWAVFSYKK